MKNYYVCMIILMMVLGFIGMSSAAIVTDPTGDLIGIGPTDIRAVRAEQMTRGDGVVLLGHDVDSLHLTFCDGPG